jgi:thiol-disulfide isomerase/thioredoxin
MRLSRRQALQGAAAVVAASAVSVSGPALAAAPPRGLRLLESRDPMPDVAFKKGDGQLTGFVEYQGAPVVALFWTTWCTVCYDEMPKLDALQAKLGSRAHIVPLSIDQAGMPAVKAYYRRRELKVLKPYLDDERIFASIMGIRGVPTGFVLDRQGNMVAASEGPVDWDSPVASQFLTSL